MTFKNLCKDRELTGDLLRQRRDFYAISLGLILFHLAGGVMKDTATLSTLPVKLAHPQVLYWSAWVSFAYFAWRYWVLDPAAWSGSGRNGIARLSRAQNFGVFAGDGCKDASHPTRTP